MRPYAAIAIMLFIAVGCSSDKKLARTALWTAANAVDVALSPDADKFAPNEVTELQNKLASLNSAYVHRDYAAVIDQAAAVSASANHLADMVLIDEQTEAKQRAQWGAYDTLLPNLLGAVHARLQELNRFGRTDTHVNLSAARVGLGQADDEWKEAMNAYVLGELTRALDASRQAKSNAEAAAAAIDLQQFADR